MSNSKTKNVWSYVLPAMLSHACFSLFSIVDGAFVGNGVGTNALGAIGLVEQTVLIGHSYMECLHNQMNSRDMWNNYTFFIPKEKFDCIPSYKAFDKQLKSAVADILKKSTPTTENQACSEVFPCHLSDENIT